jgi:hypothetical protein
MLINNEGETYPALTQPPFSAAYGKNDIYTGTVTSVTLEFADRPTVEISPSDLFPYAHNQADATILALADHPDVDPHSKYILRERIRDMHLDGEVDYLKISRQQFVYDAAENTQKASGEPSVSTIDLRIE